ncbi:hypothetical protein HGM15179_015206 [Zosterops borbonicus]|uniref:Uncharacterized protein n=1 Tax=Zosterops borbonicus TaxID=364589 RepID=A0A8K1G4W1_9PASS|nr:hypothetical protein HGM15179_015206 [Zosterops borbonicus]
MIICERSNSADIKASENGEDAPGTGAEILVQPLIQNRVRQLCSCSPWRSMVEEKSICSLWRITGAGGHTRSLWLCEKPVLDHTPGRTCGSTEQACWQEFRSHESHMLEQYIPEGLHHITGTPTGTVHEELQPLGRSHNLLQL